MTDHSEVQEALELRFRTVSFREFGGGRNVASSFRALGRG